METHAKKSITDPLYNDLRLIDRLYDIFIYELKELNLIDLLFVIFFLLKYLLEEFDTYVRLNSNNNITMSLQTRPKLIEQSRFILVDLKHVIV